LAIHSLDETHDCAQFDCGEETLNHYLKAFALIHGKSGFGRTFVSIEDGPRVYGYHTIAPSAVSPNVLPEYVPRYYPTPVILLGRLAVDRERQGTGLGRDLLMDSLKRARELADLGGGYAVYVEALNEQARTFYLRYGFKQCTDNGLHLYLRMKAIRKLDL
jgi:GNAT superfamily N-acetyltransferase